MTPRALATLHARAMSHPPPYSEAEFSTLLDAPGVFLVGDSVGFALGRAVADEAELLTIAVDPGARRKGHGCRWLRAFAAEAEKRGAVQAFLEVDETNTAARALYAKEGWRAVGRRKGYYRPPGGGASDALVLSKALLPGA